MLSRLKINNVVLALAAIWVIVQALILYTNHVGTINEAEKYINEANNLLLNHKLTNSKYIFYFLPILNIAASLKANMGYNLAIFIQLIVNAAATAVFYKIAFNLNGNALKSAVATFIYITFIPLQQWNSFLYTESLFYSLCIFLIYACVVLPNTKISTHILRLAILAVMVFTRPLGLLFIPVLFFLYVATANWPKTVKWITAVGTPFLLYALLTFLYRGGEGMDILLPQQQAMVICFQPQAAPAGLVIPNTNNPLNNLALFIFYNPAYFLKLAAARLLSFFNLCKTGYSTLHNLYFICYMVLLYGFAIVSFIGPGKTNKPLLYTFVVLAVILCVGVMLQCNEYNNRFSLTLFPWIILFATDGIFSLKNKAPRSKT